MAGQGDKSRVARFWRRAKNWFYDNRLVLVAWLVACAIGGVVVLGNLPLFACAVPAIFPDASCTGISSSPSEILRNLAVFFVAIIGFPLVVWRGLSADRQAKAAEDTLRHERRQAALKKFESKDAEIRYIGVKEIEELDSEFDDKYNEG